MDYITKFVLENTIDVIPEKYIFLLFIIAFISNGVYGLLTGKYGKKIIDKGIMDRVFAICIIACIYIWSLKLFMFVIMVYYLGEIFFGLIFSIYKSIEIHGESFIFFKNGIITGPSLKTQINHKIKIDGGSIIWKIPAENEKNKKEWGKHLTENDYVSHGYMMPVEKFFFTQMWFFYDRYDHGRGKVILHVSVQKMENYFPLDHIENLNLAASHYRFSNLDFTHIGGEWIRDIKKNLLSEKWKVKNINGKPAISYRVNDNEFLSNRYENNKYAYCNLVHTAISENKMLTIRLYCTADSSFVEKLCDEFSQRILNSWELCPAFNDSVEHLSGDGHKDKYASEDKHGGGDRAISQHVFEPFSYCLLDEEAFKIILRNNSENKIEWYLFECSDFFDDWFNQQYKYIEKEYTQKIREYVNQSVLSLQQKVSVKKEEA